MASASRVHAVPFQRSTLPLFARKYSSKTYEYIQTSQPKPGVGQGELGSPCWAARRPKLTRERSDIQPPQGPQRPLHSAD